MEEKKIMDEQELTNVVGGQTKEEYYEDFRRLDLLDGPSPRHNGEECRNCVCGKLKFYNYQSGPFGNREAIYYCDTCHEYELYAVEE